LPAVLTVLQDPRPRRILETSKTAEQKVFVTINLLQGFEVTGIDLDRIDASEEDGEAEFDYEVFPCQCSETFSFARTAS
jgi:hypothetical protein